MAAGAGPGHGARRDRAGAADPDIAFVYWFLPETKGLPVEEIIRVFERQQKHPLAPASTIQEGS